MSTTTTLFPNGPVSVSTGTIITGAPTVWQALSDGSDATYVDLQDTGGSFEVTMDNYTLPANSQVKSVLMQARLKNMDSGTEKVQMVQLYFSPSESDQCYYQNYANTTVAFLRSQPILGRSSGVAFSDPDIDGMHVKFATGVLPSSNSPIRVYGLLVEVLSLLNPSVSNISVYFSVIGTPTVTWQFNGDGGEPQTYWRLKLFTEAVASAGGFDPETSVNVYDSGEVPGVRTDRTCNKLPAGNYRAYVKVAQARKQWSDWSYLAFANNYPPNPPTITYPVNSTTVDTGPGFTMTWNYTHPQHVGQAKYKLMRITDGSTVEFWTGAAWSGTEQYVTSTSQSIAFLAGTWPDGHDYVFQILVQDANGYDSQYGSAVSIRGQGPPVVNITAPTTTITTTTRPIITWTYTDPQSYAQTAWQVKVFLTSDTTASGFDPETSTLAVYDSGIQYGAATSVDHHHDFRTDGTSFTIYARVSSIAQWSAWDAQTFNVSITPPVTPTVTAVAQPATNSVLITSTGSSDASTYDHVLHTIQRSVNGGPWETVRGADGLVPNTSYVTTIVDYELVARTSTVYRSKRVGYLSDGSLVASAWGLATAVTLTPTSCWIKDPLDPTRNIAFAFDPGIEEKRTLNSGAFAPFGRTEMVVISEPEYRGAQLTLSIWSKTASDRAALEMILDPSKTLLVQDVIPHQWYFRLMTDKSRKPLITVDLAAPRGDADQVVVQVAEVEKP